MPFLWFQRFFALSAGIKNGSENNDVEDHDLEFGGKLRCGEHILLIFVLHTFASRSHRFGAIAFRGRQYKISFVDAATIACTAVAPTAYNSKEKVKNSKEKKVKGNKEKVKDNKEKVKDSKKKVKDSKEKVKDSKKKVKDNKEKVKDSKEKVKDSKEKVKDSKTQHSKE